MREFKVEDEREEREQGDEDEGDRRDKIGVETDNCPFVRYKTRETEDDV